MTIIYYILTSVRLFVLLLTSRDSDRPFFVIMDNLVNNLDLFMILREQVKSLSDSQKFFQFLQHKINVTEENSVELQKFCTRFCSNISARWERSSRTLAQFVRKNGDWLERAINWPEGMIPEAVNTEQERLEICNTEDVENLPPSTTEASTSTFTPRKPFEELGSRQKRRRVDQINQSLSLSPDELKATTIASLRNTGNEDVGKIMNHLLNHPEDLEKVKECLSTSKPKSSTYSPDKALSLLVSLKLSKWQYISLREAASENRSDLYPSYYKIKQAKAKCYPGKEDIIITEEGAAIKLQALLNLTVSRLLEVITLDLDSPTELLLISKWGFDGASGQSNYKQKTEAEFDDSTIFMASLVPIRLQQCDGTIVWENDRPSSTFYCRPIMFKFTKETQSTVVTIKASITEEIERLQPIKFNQVEVKHQLHLTMIDGKISSYLSDTSSAVCDICKAKPSEMNNLESLAQKENNEEVFQYGMSSLHAWIRSMECLLHIECGRIPEGEAGLPWHVSIKELNDDKPGTYKTICGGSIISNNIVVTAAVCFSGPQIKLSRYSVVTLATPKPLEISDVKIPAWYRDGISSNFQSDIALVFLKTPLEYSTQVQPVCLDFDTNFERRQLQKGSLGKVKSWSQPVDNRSSMEVLEIPYMSIEQCITKSPPEFRKYITTDKFCAGHVNESVICKGYFGAGLSYPEEYRGIAHHYLRGVASLGSPSKYNVIEAECAVKDVVTFTQVNKYENFFKEHIVKPVRSSKCVLPPYPEHGRYAVSKAPYATPGQGFQSLQLNVTCNSGYGVFGSNVISCQDGNWSHSTLKCVRFCRLEEHPSVHYYCLISNDGDSRRICSISEPTGTVVRPECNSPSYFSSSPLPLMRCDDGSWDNVAICSPECGRIPKDGGGLPWHVSIKSKIKNSSEFKIICGGSIISNEIIVSAAVCFYELSSDIEPSRYTVITWATRQSFGVSDIKIPAWYHGLNTNLQSDIALVFLKPSIRYSMQIQPVCVNFDTSFESRQLQEGNIGKMKVWWEPIDNISSFEVLEVPFISIEQCITQSHPGFRKYITSDKFCAHSNGTVLCLSNAGAGLSFPEEQGGVIRHYLRGVESLDSHWLRKPSHKETCAAADIVTFTQVNKHENFIREYFEPILSGKCVLPPYPEHGSYVVTNAPYATPGQGFSSLQLKVTCKQGYGVLDGGLIFCQGGTWSHAIPKCVRFCKLDKHPSVHYHCLISGDVEGRRACNTYEPPGTVIRPECNRPNYYSSTPLPFMRCNEGSWNYVAVCNPECGLVTPDAVGLIIDGRPALRGELPWHVGIYRKSSRLGVPYEQICGASLVTTSVVISAAHCFWDDILKQLPATNFAVATAKLYRAWNNPLDRDAQKSDVKAIHIPPLFQGRQANFQEDIAVVVLKTPFVYHNYVRPVCLNFDLTFSWRQLQHGNLGKVAGWGLTEENGEPSRILKVVELPYVNIKQCIEQLPLTFRENITGDKICAGYTNGTALCRGDSGGGLAFPEPDRGTDRYYLRGVVSTAPRSEENECNANTITAFTGLMRHQDFINQYL